jgi:outer membrane receptor protein involved in Fe transport
MGSIITLTKRPLVSRQRLLTGIALGVATLGSDALLAQEVLTEITVTARKVQESLQDAPVSAVVFDGARITESGIVKIEELVNYVPSFAMSETGIGTNLYVRGIGSGINQGFEQSVGLYIDGIYYGRAQLTRAPFLDLAQVEALRGPQATLLGNNSIAGALNLATKKPTEEFEASASGLYEPDHDEREITGIISGPLTDRLSARFAGRYRSMDGYITNNIRNRDEPDREEKSGRVTFGWVGDSWDGTLKLETNSFDVVGRQIEIIRADPSTQAAVTNGLTSATGFSRNTGSSSLWLPNFNYLEYLGQFFDNNPAIQNDTLDYVRGSNGDSSNNDIDAAVLALNTEIGAHTVSTTLGYLTYDYVENCDCDFTGADQFQLISEEEYDQASIEFRVTSPQDQAFTYLGGAYYQADNLDFGDQILLPVGSGVVELVGYATQGNPNAANNSLGNTSVFRDFEQNTYVSAVFGQVAYKITDAWRTSLGLRFAHVEKEAARRLQQGTLNRVPFDINVPAEAALLDSGAVLFSSIFKAAFHDLSGSRTENNLAWEFVTDYDISDDVMVYGSVKKGFKSGGFDVRSNSEPVPGTTGAGKLYPASLGGPGNAIDNNVDPGSFEFEDEQALAFEVGSKLTLLDGTAELNVAVFLTEFDDLQVSIFDGTLGFNVGNAAKATTQGVELDGRWSLSENWFLTGSLGWLDFEFDNFKNGQCTQGQTPTYPTNFPDPLLAGKCDYTGKTNQYVADWSGALGLNYEHPLGSALWFRSTLDVLFTDDYQPSQNLDSRVQQDAYAQINLRLAVADVDGRWEVALLGRNLTDEEVVTYANDTPLAFSQFGSPTWYGFVDRSRNVAVQANYKFAGP